MNKMIEFTFDARVDKAIIDPDTGKMVITAVVSDDRLDLQRDRMSQGCLGQMAKQCVVGIPLLETHRSVFHFGKTIDGVVVKGIENNEEVRQLAVKCELDASYPQAKQLFKEVQAGNCIKQLSIGGKLNLSNREAVSVEMTKDGLIRTIHDIELDHIATTRAGQAANPRTGFLEAVSKALDEAVEKGWVLPPVETPVPAAIPVLDADAQNGLDLLRTLGQAMHKAANPKPEANAPAVTDQWRTSDVEVAEDGKKPAEKAVPAPVIAPAATVSVAAIQVKEAQPGGVVVPAQAGGIVVEAAVPLSPQGLDTERKTNMKGGATALDLANQVASLLSKREKTKLTLTSTPDELLTDKDLTLPLWNLRYAIAKDETLRKELSGAGYGPGEQAALGEIIAGGLFAPTDESAATGKGCAPDKAQGSTDVAASAVSDNMKHDHVAGGEIKSTAPTAKEALGLTMATANAAGVVKGFDEAAILEKALQQTGIVLTKSLEEVSKSIVTQVTDQVEKRMSQSETAVQKGLDSMGGVVNSMAERLAKSEAEIKVLGAAGGVSHTGPRGNAPDSETAGKVQKSTGLWGGLFGKAVENATSKF